MGTYPSRVATAALSVAIVYGVLLVVAAFFAPVYRWTSASSGGELAQGSETLVGANGLGAVVVTAVPLMAALLVGSALRLGSRRGAVTLAWVVTGLLGVLNMLAIASIGLFILPATVALVVACAASAHWLQLAAADADSAAHHG